ncbi:uncharacterized protein F5891DRAFT_991630 [Suillus fuscotomentosus]|uniref:Uncharacterized protein n=1 Tax=Suillus fuscotomentosus TaxID=1912939 RepID=A0AAD4HS68_9AGAM|nr:uncharacterized protein F5891DRAFT_991630 [Suillus fuscotomentosus]KAG1908130.1 hypothetical protein F5891DRAFT_991630 [Suillus fuscotomentosus]
MKKQKSDRLDNMAFRKIEEICAVETEKSEHMDLYVDPSRVRFNLPVIKSVSATFCNTRCLDI